MVKAILNFPAMKQEKQKGNADVMLVLGKSK